MAAKTGGAGIAKKVGPLPAWGWAVAAVVVYFLYKRFASSSSAAVASSPASVGTGTTTVPLDSGGGAPASGQGSSMDNLTAGLLSSLAGDLVYVNSNLVTGLLGAQSSIEGLGTAALQQQGMLEQAIINGKLWGSSNVNVTVTGGGGSSSGGGGSSAGGGGSSSGSPVNGSPGSTYTYNGQTYQVQVPTQPGGGGRLVQ